MSERLKRQLESEEEQREWHIEKMQKVRDAMQDQYARVDDAYRSGKIDYETWEKLGTDVIALSEQWGFDAAASAESAIEKLKNYVDKSLGIESK